MNYLKIKTLIGNLHLYADDNFLYGVFFDTNHYLAKSLKPAKKQSNAILEESAQQIQEYLIGERKGFDLPFKLDTSEFKTKVWNSLTKIPYGQVINYQEQAKKIKRPKAMRAVGSANGKNPLAIIIPCHRVVSKNGNLGGYSGGLRAKQFLLDLEQGKFADIKDSLKSLIKKT